VVELTLRKADPKAKYFVDGKTFDEARLKLVRCKQPPCSSHCSFSIDRAP
jgi:hypothetical protein